MRQVDGDKDKWVEITQNEAIAKTSQLLRDARPKDNKSKAAAALLQVAVNLHAPINSEGPPESFTRAVGADSFTTGTPMYKDLIHALNPGENEKQEDESKKKNQDEDESEKKETF